MKQMAIIAGLSVILICGYFLPYETLWFIVGALWGLVNLYFISQLMHGLLIENPTNLVKVGLLALIKFPILYTVGFGLLYVQNEVSWGLLLGFSVVLALGIVRQIRQTKVLTDRQGMV